MFVVMDAACSPQDIAGVLQALPAMDAIGRPSAGGPPCVIEVLAAGAGLDAARLRRLPAVADVVEHASQVRDLCQVPADAPREVPLGPDLTVGGGRLAVIAGPCSVEDEGRLLETAHAVAAAGAVALRGGAFKPRTAPYSFQGLGDAALAILARVREQTGLAIVTEVMAREQIARVAEVADVLQVGSRNMHNTPLLRAVGEQGRPVLLKRGWSATLEEFLMAAAYVQRAGNPNVVLCERGIRTFEEYVRNTLALAVVPEARRLSGLPVVVDPSHGTGRAHLVAPMCRAALACGADGLLIEVHPEPARAWSDGDQSLDLTAFGEMMAGLRSLAAACERELGGAGSATATGDTRGSVV